MSKESRSLWKSESSSTNVSTDDAAFIQEREQELRRKLLTDAQAAVDKIWRDYREKSKRISKIVLNELTVRSK